METLGKLFGNTTRVKLLRLFLLSPDKVFTFEEASHILQAQKTLISKEIRVLVNLRFLKKSSRIDHIHVRLKEKDKKIKKHVEGFILQRTFPYLLPLRNLLVTASPVSRERMFKFFKSRGRTKLLALGGVFINDFAEDPLNYYRLDLLIVGDAKRGDIERFIKNLEAEIGKELNWTLMNQLEFEHRFAMHDKLLRDLFDYPHEFLINKLAIE